MARLARTLHSFGGIKRTILLWAACAALAILGVQSTSAQRDSDTPFVPGELLVRFRRAAPESQRDGLRRAVGSRLVRRFEQFGIEHVKLPANVSMAEALRVLRQSPDVLSAAPNYLTYVAASAPPNDPYWLANSPPNLWGLQKINAQPAWNNFGSDSYNVVVAMIDTGTDYNHPDLAANIWTSVAPFTFQGVTCPAGTHGVNTFAIPMTCDPMDNSGHGTFTAGIVGGVGNNGIGVVGVNWNVQIMECKANGADGVGTSASAIACFNFIVDQKVNHGVNVRVINNSWGTYAYDPNLQAAMDTTAAAGIINVAAAGNVGSDNDGPNPFYPASFTSPGIVSVAASDSNDNPAVFEDINPATGLHYSTNYGATSVDLAAPGALIVSTFWQPGASGGYFVNGGSSYASAHVSGVAARLAAVNPTLTVSQLKTILMSSVDPLDQWSGKVVTGGRLNMYKALQVLYGQSGNQGSAAFVGLDTSTRGSWSGVYGKDGYMLANDATSLPSYAQVGLVGQQAWTWAASTTDPRALQRPGGTDRIAATWYSASSFSIDVNITDGALHHVALYNVDWDTANARTQRVDVLDPTTGAVLDTRTVTAFTNGQYLVWTIGGHVTIRVTKTGPVNAIVSALFFDASASSSPPTITTPPASQVITSGQTATMSVAAIGAAPLTYQWYVGTSGTTTTPIAGATESSYTTPALTTTTSYWVRVSNALGTANSATATITVQKTVNATAAFVRTDTTTQGTWLGMYGSEGYALANDATALPGYAKVVWAGQQSWTWAASTTDPRALRRPLATDRIAATWYSATNFTVDVNIADGATHQVALYHLDWDAANTRVERVDVLDATSGAVLDTRTVTAFSSGQYLVWTIGGHVTFRVTNTGPLNAVVSGLFFDPNPSSSPPTITTSPASQAITPGQTATMSVAAIGATPLTYQWYVGTSGTTTTPIAGATASSYTTPALTTTTNYWVRVSNALGTANSATATITVRTVANATAAFVRTDTTTQGTWLGVYGSDGYSLANDATALPSYAQVVWGGQQSWTWAASTTDPRALRRPLGTDRIAATWYSATNFTIDINIADGATHQVALYHLDWDAANARAERVDVLDATSGAVLATRTITAFSNGQYLVWTIGGHVKFRMTNTGPLNAVVSGLFFK